MNPVARPKGGTRRGTNIAVSNSNGGIGFKADHAEGPQAARSTLSSSSTHRDGRGSRIASAKNPLRPIAEKGMATHTSIL
jgi:hypothetical protein